MNKYEKADPPRTVEHLESDMNGTFTDVISQKFNTWSHKFTDIYRLSKKSGCCAGVNTA